MKKLINAPADVVSEALLGVAAAHPELRVDHENKIVFRGDAPGRARSALISGGGSGHEPLHGGFVGDGMLDAACSGEVFTSPVPDQILAATKGVDGGAGVLHIVKNYTGDVMNFEMAAELRRRRRHRGRRRSSPTTTSRSRTASTPSGRRGVGVTVLVEKIAGAAAEEGRSLAEVADLARKVNGDGRSMGIALTSCTVPAAGKPTFDLPEDEMEVGIGIHGEPGRARGPMAPAAEIAQMLVEPILDDQRLRRRRRRARLRQRHGRHAADRALPDVRRGATGCSRRPGIPVARIARRQLHHQPRHGRVLGHPARGSTTSCCGCGTLRSRRRRCGGACDGPGAPGSDR